MTRRRFAVMTAALFAAARLSADPAGSDAPRELPVREVTVFKDGHAFVLAEGELPVDPAGNVVLDRLPAPVLGTFWPYSASPGPRLASVVAGVRKVRVEKNALTLLELIRGNPGAEVLITETSGVRYAGSIAGVPERAPDEAAGSAGAAAGGRPARTGEIVLIRTDGGTKALPATRIQDITFLGKGKETFGEEEARDELTLRLDWGGAKPAATARVGVGYIQKGLRWIPEYRVALNGKGEAVVRLQATLINELTDLENVTAHLVIGVPTFLFKETLDPISIQKNLAPLSAYFQEDADPEKARGYLVTLSREAERLHHLVGNVLAYSRLERSSPRDRLERIAVDGLIERAAVRFRERAEGAGMTLEIEGASAVEGRVLADPAAVEQILFNLVDNAVKYAGRAADRRIHLQVGRRGAAIIFRVRDHGPGISPAFARKLFRPFSKSAQEAAATAPGVGLGLALSRRLARAMDGDLILDPAEAEGAAFELRLPAA